ncbi:MAG: hypothetical protein ABS81_23395 [Pseudonocardia sp. SCN 72-86]|nr:MAG: hypothetical protein ABS81_23395 [Pseudonocardia sp. SCN 72-86]
MTELFEYAGPVPAPVGGGAGGPIDVVALAEHPFWDLPPELDALRVDGPVRRPDLAAGRGSWLVVARVAGRPVGYASITRTPADVPAGHPRAAALTPLGADRRHGWLGAGLELVDLGIVDDPAHDRVARSIDLVVTQTVPRRRAWTVVDRHDLARRCTLRRLGWVPVGTGTDGPILMLAAGHPAVASGEVAGVRAPRVPARWAPWTATGRATP